MKFANRNIPQLRTRASNPAGPLCNTRMILMIGRVQLRRMSPNVRATLGDEVPRALQPARGEDVVSGSHLLVPRFGHVVPSHRWVVGASPSGNLTSYPRLRLPAQSSRQLALIWPPHNIGRELGSRRHRWHGGGTMSRER
jgi:hypothetical protein